MIQVHELTRRFHDRVAVDRLSFTARRGEILGLLGPNGAGKTTVVRMLTGALSATSGSASVAGFDIFEEPIEVKRRVGYLPETPPLYPELTPREYLAFVCGIRGVPRRQVRAEVDRVIEVCDLEEVRRRVIGVLSSGFRQRVGIAQALLGSPPLLVFDEPTRGLDPRQVPAIRELLRSLAAGEHTVILCTHILPEVERICSRILILSAGRLVADGDREALLEGFRRDHDRPHASLEELFITMTS